MDGAVLVVSAVEGVQPQTEILFQALCDQGLPCLVFVNKTDREGADIHRVLKEMQSRLSPRIFLHNDPDAQIEQVCEEDESLMEAYLMGEALSDDVIGIRLREMICNGRIYPAYCGSALRDTGIEPLLDAVVSFLPSPLQGEEQLSGVVFSSLQDRLLGRGVWVRLYGGVLNARDAVTLPGQIDVMTGERIPVQKKIFQIRDVQGNDTGILRAGQIGQIFGLG